VPLQKLAMFVAAIMLVTNLAEADHRSKEQGPGNTRGESRTAQRIERQAEKPSYGTYVGGSLAIGVEQFNGVATGDDYDEGFGFDIWIGSRIHRHVGVEGQLSYIEGFELAGTGIGFNHLNGKIQPYFLAGAGVGRFELEEPDGYTLSDTGGVMRVGVGVDVYLNDRIALVGGLGYLFTAGDIVDNDIMELKFGVQYRF
jgi:opacity protein-like surface antigen